MIAVVERIAAGGEGIVRVDGEVFLVPGVVPGDRVELRPLEAKRGARRARLLSVVVPSADRVEPSCPLVDRCGGCPLMRIAPAAQLRAKVGLLREALRTELPFEVAAGALFEYRTRARVRWSRAAVGYVRAGSREVVDVGRCPVLAAPVAHGLEVLRDLFAAAVLGRGGEAHLAAAAGGATALAIAPDSDPTAELFRALESLVAAGRIAGAVVVSAGSSRAEIGDAAGEAAGGDGLPIRIDPDGFAQPSALHVTRMGDALAALVSPGDRVLELHAGAGTWTVALARVAASVQAIEVDPRASKRLEENLRARGLTNVHIRNEAALSALSSAGKSPALVVLDPPRTGAAEEVVAIAGLSPRRIAYVSCDPATLGRDIRLLSKHGYALEALHAWDLMPQTAEVEALAVLERA